MAPERIELIGGKIFGTDEQRITINMFAQIKHGQTLQQVRSLIDLAPLQPKIYKL